MFLTSDPHFGHANIIRYCDRPYVDSDEMDAALAANWNRVVSASDDVLILGDLTMTWSVSRLAAFLAELNGSITIVPGNHDVFWPGRIKAGGRTAASVQEAVETLAATGVTVDADPAPLDIAGELAALHHFPYRGDSGDHDDRYIEHRPVDTGGWLIHGHVHEQWRQRGRMINVGVDAWSQAPVHLDTIADLIKAGPNDLAPLPQRG